MLIYQFGCISWYYNNNEFYKASNWRKQQRDILNSYDISYGFKFFDPTYNFDINNKNINNKSIVDQNRLYLLKSDILTGSIEHILDSPGSMWEIFIGSEMKKPVLSFGDINNIKNAHILNSITQHFNTLDEMCDYIVNVYGGFIK